MHVQRTTVLLLAAVAAAGGASACSAYPSTSPVPIDCASETGYVFDSTLVPFANAFTASDGTPGNVATVATDPIPGGALCNDSSASNALVITWARNNDWGGLVGFYGFGTDTAESAQANYGFKQPYAQALLTVRPRTVGVSFTRTF